MNTFTLTKVIGKVIFGKVNTSRHGEHEIKFMLSSKYAEHREGSFVIELYEDEVNGELGYEIIIAVEQWDDTVSRPTTDVVESTFTVRELNELKAQ